MLAMYKKKDKMNDVAPISPHFSIWSPAALFILALRGLSSPATSRQGNRLRHDRHGDCHRHHAGGSRRRPSRLAWVLIIGGIAIGGAIGAVTARRIAMTAMPQLVAAFHSLVGLAAVFVAAAAFYAPDAFGIAQRRRDPRPKPDRDVAWRRHRRLTFTGSIIAFPKLDGRMSGAPIMLPARHAINIALGVALIALIVIFF